MLIDLKIINSETEPDYMVKLWTYELYDVFNFKLYCFYYFTLTKEEKKAFNKLASSIMENEIKQSMLKKRVPWEHINSYIDEHGDNIVVYRATWRSVWFRDGYITFCKADSEFSHPFRWGFSEEKINLLWEYLSRKSVDKLDIVTKNDNIFKVDGLDALEELIWKVQIQYEVETNSSKTIKKIDKNRIPVNMLIRNKCVRLLNYLQIEDYKPTRVLERRFSIDKGSLSVDISLLFSVPLNRGNVAIIWESVELDKAKTTHIFKCTENKYDELIEKIEAHISENIRVRSSLNSNDYFNILQQKELNYLCRVNHDNFDYSVWENALCDALPDLYDKIQKVYAAYDFTD